MVLRTRKAHESVRNGVGIKAKPSSSDFWGFLEEIDAPQWVDLAMEANSSKEERDDSWFHTVHPFHQRSFRDLVSSSPIGVKVKGKESKAIYVYPSLVNSVLKSRGKAGKKQSWPKSSASCIQLHPLEQGIPIDCRTVHSGDKTSSGDDANSGLNSCLHKPPIDIAVETSAAGSTSNGNKLKKPTDAHIETGINDPQNPLAVSEVKAAMARTTGLLSVLKMSSLRRSCGYVPALRVELKDEEQSKDRKSSSNKVSSQSSNVIDRKTSSIGSSNNNVWPIKKQGETLKMKNQTENNITSAVGHNRKKSSVGSSDNVEGKIKKGYETLNAINKSQRTLTELERKIFMSARSGQGHLGNGRKPGAFPMRGESGCKNQALRKPLQDISNAGIIQQCKIIGTGKQKKNVGTIQTLKIATDKENGGKGTLQGQKGNTCGKKISFTSTKDANHAQGIQAKLKATGKPKGENILPSIIEIQKWEKNSGCIYFRLGQLQREKANREIRNSRACY